MIIVKIFKIVGRILETLIVLALLLYPWLVLGQNPFTFYWNEFKELWNVILSWSITNKIVGLVILK